MNKLENVKVGDKLTHIERWGYNDRKWSFTTVAKVNKRFVTDANGRQWNMAGHRWGDSRSMHYRGHVEPYTPEHDARATEAKERNKLDLMRSHLQDQLWRTIDDDTVRKVYALVKNAKPEANQ